MAKLWLRIWISIKVGIVLLLLIYVGCFVSLNNKHDTELWIWYGTIVQSSTLQLAFFSFLAGVIATVLVQTSFKTLRQIRDMQDRSRNQRLQRQTDDARTKAAMLRAKPATDPTGET